MFVKFQRAGGSPSCARELLYAVLGEERQALPPTWHHPAGIAGVTSQLPALSRTLGRDGYSNLPVPPAAREGGPGQH